MATSIIGKLADKANIVKSSFSEFEKAIIKATRHNHKQPKEKHVRRLIVYTSESTGRCSEIILLLGKRLEIPDWIVVMKTLCVFHRLMRDGNPKFLSELKYKMGVFNLRKFSDMSTPEASHQSVFIRKYSQYLEEKMLVFKILGLEFEKDPNVTKSFTVQEGFDKIPRLQSQINALLNCRGSRDHLNNTIIIGCFTLLLKDSFPLYRALNDAIIILLENYFTMPRENAVKALEIYKLFSKETDGMIQFFDIAKKFSRSDLPELQHAPSSLVEALENYIAELDSGRAPTSNTDGKATVSQTRTLIKQSQNKMENFRFDDQDAADSDSDDEVQSNTSFPEQFPQNGNTNSTQQNFETQKGPTQPINLMDDLFDSPNTFSLPTTATTTTATNKTPTAFDPFEISIDNQANNSTYSDKKKNVEILMNQPTFAVSSTPLQPQTARPVAPVMYGTQPSFVPVTSQTPQPANPFQPAYTGNPYGSQYGVQPALNPFSATPAPQTNPFLQPQSSGTNQNPFL